MIKLRQAIYSPEFRAFVSEITGCPTLVDRTDCSSNLYAQGCHLLCHDDVIGTRCGKYDGKDCMHRIQIIIHRWPFASTPFSVPQFPLSFI